MFGTIKISLAPGTVKRASLLMLSYAVVVLIGTVWFAVQTDFSQTKELFRGLVRVAGISGLAFWLLTLDKRAWWLSIGACSFLAILGVIGIVTLGFAGLAYDTSLLWFVLKLVVPVYLLGHAVLILAKRETRDLFHAI